MLQTYGRRCSTQSYSKDVYACNYSWRKYMVFCDSLRLKCSQVLSCFPARSRAVWVTRTAPAPCIGHLPGDEDRLRPGLTVILWVGPAPQGPWPGRAARLWGPANCSSIAGAGGDGSKGWHGVLGCGGALGAWPGHSQSWWCCWDPGTCTASQVAVFVNQQAFFAFFLTVYAVLKGWFNFSFAFSTENISHTKW